MSWVLPASTRAIGETQHVRYDPAPPWDPARCVIALKPGAAALGRELARRFPAIVRVGGFNCRPNTADPEAMSVHGTGRALDLMLEAGATLADGDRIANWLVEHARSRGVQFLIWNRTKWNGSRPGRKDAPYTGPNAHLDHIHVELTESAAGGGALWAKLLLAGAIGGGAAWWWRGRRRRR